MKYEAESMKYEVAPGIPQKSPPSYTQVARGEVYEPAYSALGIMPFTAIRLGWALALLGTRTVKIPLALVALI